MKAEINLKRKNAGHEIGNGTGMKRGNPVKGVAAEFSFWCTVVPLK